MFTDPVFRKSSYSGAANNCVEVANWWKSSYSKASGECVEAAHAVSGECWIRNSKEPGRGHLAFALPEWTTFVISLKAADTTA